MRFTAFTGSHTYSRWNSGIITPRISVSVRDPPTLVSRLDDVAVVGDPVEQRGSHLLVTEHLRPLTEGEVSGDHGGVLIEL